MTESRRRLRKNPNINPAAVDIPIGVHGFSFTYACVAGVACLALLPASVRAQTSCAFASSSLRSNRPRSAVKPSPENRSRDPAHDGRHAGSAEQDHSDACDPYQQVGRFVDFRSHINFLCVCAVSNARLLLALGQVVGPDPFVTQNSYAASKLRDPVAEKTFLGTMDRYGNGPFATRTLCAAANIQPKIFALFFVLCRSVVILALNASW